MRLADFVAEYVATLTPRVYGVVGAGAMYLNDAICNHPQIKFIAMHHEQAAAMAAEADSRVSGKIGVVHVTAGPGGTNAITGIAGAWVDSIPMLVIAGQVATTAMKRDGLRQLGTNELGMVEMVRSITKYSTTVIKSEDILSVLETAVFRAMDGRRGPVFVEIPLDVQSAEIDPLKLIQTALQVPDWVVSSYQIDEVVAALNAAKRPLIFAGNGVHLAGAEIELRRLVYDYGIPVVTSWNGIDLFQSNDPLVVGRPGIMGDRAGNFAVQNADVILAIGTRLSVPQIGHHGALFAPHAQLIHVDIDGKETAKTGQYAADIRIVADAKEFLTRLLSSGLKGSPSRVEGDPGRIDWMNRCTLWKSDYPVMLPEYREATDGVNSYAFIEELGKHLDDDAIVVTDVGAAYISTMQSLQLRGTQRLFHSGGVSAMGYGIPAAIGACMAGGGRQVVCLVGDGGAMVNLQELQTITHHQLPIAIFVFVNNGYMTMQYTQETHFRREAASSPQIGIQCSNLVRIADAMNIPSYGIYSKRFLGVVKDAIKQKYPTLCSVHMPANQLLQPRVQSKTVDGKFVPVPIHDMWPYLSREELAENMQTLDAHEFSA